MARFYFNSSANDNENLLPVTMTIITLSFSPGSKVELNPDFQIQQKNIKRLKMITTFECFKKFSTDKKCFYVWTWSEVAWTPVEMFGPQSCKQKVSFFKKYFLKKKNNIWGTCKSRNWDRMIQWGSCVICRSTPEVVKQFIFTPGDIMMVVWFYNVMMGIGIVNL